MPLPRKDCFCWQGGSQPLLIFQPTTKRLQVLYFNLFAQRHPFLGLFLRHRGREGCSRFIFLCFCCSLRAESRQYSCSHKSALLAVAVSGNASTYATFESQSTNKVYLDELPQPLLQLPQAFYLVVHPHHFREDPHSSRRRKTVCLLLHSRPRRLLLAFRPHIPTLNFLSPVSYPLIGLTFTQSSKKALRISTGLTLKELEAISTVAYSVTMAYASSQSYLWKHRQRWALESWGGYLFLTGVGCAPSFPYVSLNLNLTFLDYSWYHAYVSSLMSSKATAFAPSPPRRWPSVFLA